MARVRIGEDGLEVRLNFLEKLLAVRRNVVVPLSSVSRVSVVDRPWIEVIPDRVSMGFAARTAPGGRFATIGPRATSGVGRALIVVYRNGKSIVVDLDPTETGWSLLVVSVRLADEIAQELRAKLST